MARAACAVAVCAATKPSGLSDSLNGRLDSLGRGDTVGRDTDDIEDLTALTIKNSTALGGARGGLDLVAELSLIGVCTQEKPRVRNNDRTLGRASIAGRVDSG